MAAAEQPERPAHRMRRPPGAPDPLGTPARRAALRLVDAVLRRGESLEKALAGATRALPGGPDRGLAHAIAAETLRRLPDLDTLIDSATKQNLPDDAKARSALRIALVQVLSLGTPQHAAIATVLPLVEGGPRRLVHGVFGTLMRAGISLPETPALPDAVHDRWRDAWGEDVVERIARAIAAPPPLDLTLADATAQDHWQAALGARSLARGHLRLGEHDAVTDLPGFADGAWWVQDVAASIPARLIGPGAGRVLDLCAAPGGKAMQLAAAGWDVTALDVSKSRLARLRDNLVRTRLTADIVEADLMGWAPDMPADAVLLDAPCSATGIVRRHPDVLHRVRPAMIAELAEIQGHMLARAADWVRPGGMLVYAACSLEPVEGEEQVRRFLEKRSDYTLVAPQAGELPVGIPVAPEGWVRTTPALLADEGGCDGFFVARLRRH